MSTRGTLSFLVSGCDPDWRRAGAVRSTLSDRRYDITIEAVDPTGDFSPDTRPDIYRDLIERVADGAVDGGICPAWGLPQALPAGIHIGAVLSRDRREDLLIVPSERPSAELPSTPTIGASSLRARTQARAHYPEGQIQPLDGSITAQIKRLLAPPLQAEHERRLAAAESEDADQSFERSPEEWFQELAELERQALEVSTDTEYDGIIASAADIDQLGFRDQLNSTVLAPEKSVPAAGQGTTVLLANDQSTTEHLYRLFDDPVARTELTVERTIETAFPSDVAAGTGVTAFVQGPYVRTIVSAPVADGRVITESRDLPIEPHRSAAQNFADEIQADYSLAAPEN